MKFYCYYILLMFSVPTKAANTSCNSLQSLKQELYNTPGNLLNLSQVFYPPYQPTTTTSLVQVVYNFQNESGELDGCDVMYLWAKEGFFLIRKKYDDVEAAGCLVGEMADVVIHKLAQQNPPPQ